MLSAKRKGERLIVYLSGEIDHCAADKLRQEIEARIAETKTGELCFDFSSVSFMDSSGVGMIIGRYKTMQALGGRVTACGLHPPVDRLFHLAGLHRIIDIAPSGRHEEA
ncbi:MAG: anti-sigma factor antagonist [Clostridia bacterium]|nr:anti-sigma factor antagonist [Clostridia bacterium]